LHLSDELLYRLCHDGSIRQEAQMSQRDRGITILAVVSFVLSQSTRLTDRQTDRRSERPSQYRVLQSIIPRSRTVKTVMTPEYYYYFFTLGINDPDGFWKKLSKI